MEEVVGKVLPGLLESHSSPALMLTSRTPAVDDNNKLSNGASTTGLCERDSTPQKTSGSCCVEPLGGEGGSGGRWRQQRQRGRRGCGLRLRRGGFGRVCAAVLRVGAVEMPMRVLWRFFVNPHISILPILSRIRKRCEVIRAMRHV